MCLGLCYQDDDGTIEVVDVEEVFLEGEMDEPMYVKWQKGMVELGFVTEEERLKYVIELSKSMYGNIDATLRFFTKHVKHITGKTMKGKQSRADPCIICYHDNDGKLILIAVMHVDNTMLVVSAGQLCNLRTRPIHVATRTAIYGSRTIVDDATALR